MENSSAGTAGTLSPLMKLDQLPHMMAAGFQEDEVTIIKITSIYQRTGGLVLPGF